jgi:hypothetical protein
MRATSLFPQCVLANQATDFLLETENASWKLRLHCGVQFPWYVLALKDIVTCQIYNSVIMSQKYFFYP